MDDEILTIAVTNLIFGVLALTIGYLYTLPRESLPVHQSTALLLASGQR